MLHFIKYNLIGIMNTLITLAVVWVLHQILNWNLELSNFLGFVAGGSNSYLMNRLWNFKSSNEKRSEISRFLIVFFCAYGLNFLVLEGCDYALKNISAVESFTKIIEPFMKPSYFANILANIVYVLASFTLYKKWVFKKDERE